LSCYLCKQGQVAAARSLGTVVCFIAAPFVCGQRDEMEIGPLIAAELNLIAGIYRIIAHPLHIRFLLDSICSFRCLDPAPSYRRS